MAIRALELAPCGATKGSHPRRKEEPVMELLDTLLTVGLLTTAYLLLFTAAR